MRWGVRSELSISMIITFCTYMPPTTPAVIAMWIMYTATKIMYPMRGLLKQKT